MYKQILRSVKHKQHALPLKTAALSMGKKDFYKNRRLAATWEHTLFVCDG